MTQQETCSSTGISLYPKGKASGCDEVVSEAYDIGHRHGDGGEEMGIDCRGMMLTIPKQSPVDEILDERSRYTHDTEAHDFSKLLASLFT